MTIKSSRFSAVRNVTTGLLVSLGFAAGANAQDAFAQETLPPAEPTSSPIASTGTSFPLVWGPFVFRPHVLYRYDDTDRLRPEPGRTVSTTRQQFSPGVLIELGDRWTLDYTPSWNYYSSDEFEDGVDHSARLQGALPYEEWQIGVTHRFADSTTPLYETAEQTDRQVHATAINVGRPISERLLGHFALNQNLRYSDSVPDYSDWSGGPGLRYKFGQTLTGRIDLIVGHTVVESSPDMVYYQPQVGVTWQATPKLSFDIYGGGEKRQFTTGPSPDQNTPLYGASIQHQPFEHTKIVFSASRSVDISYFIAQTTESTRWALDLDQRLFGFLLVEAGLTRQDAEYRSTLSDLALSRSDDRDTWYVRLSTEVLRRGRISLSYRENESSSSRPGFGYASEQTTFELTYRY